MTGPDECCYQQLGLLLSETPLTLCEPTREFAVRDRLARIDLIRSRPRRCGLDGGFQQRAVLQRQSRMALLSRHQAQWHAIGQKMSFERRCRGQVRLSGADELVDDLVGLRAPDQPPRRGDRTEPREQLAERGREDRSQRLLPIAEKGPETLWLDRLFSVEAYYPALVVGALKHLPRF